MKSAPAVNFPHINYYNGANNTNSRAMYYVYALIIVPVHRS